MALKDNCNICKDKLIGSMVELRKANCGHIFHFDCVKGVLEGTKIVCPECNSDINGFHETETSELKKEIELQELIQESQQISDDSKKVSIVPMANLLESTNTNEIQNLLQDIQMSLEQASITISKKYASAAEKYSTNIENAMAEKNQIIKDLEQQLKDTALALEQEKEISKLINVQHNKLREYMITTFKPDAARDIVKEHYNNIKSNSSVIPDGATAEQNEKLLDDDFEKVTFDAAADENCGKT